MSEGSESNARVMRFGGLVCLWLASATSMVRAAPLLVEVDLGATKVGPSHAMSVFICRIALVLAMLRIVLPWSRFRKRFWSFLLEPDSPFTLAATRIVVFSTMAAFKLVRSDFDIGLYLSAPADSQINLAGYGWLGHPAFLGHSLSLHLQTLLPYLCLLAAVGLFTRFTAGAATLVALYVLGVPQFFGKTLQCNHLVWFGAVLAFSRCADVWSIDARLGRCRRIPDRSVEYGLPMRVIWLLIGVIFFFPGFAKVFYTGPEWIFSDNLIRLFHYYWSVTGNVPSVRFDRIPFIGPVAALATVSFELACPFLMLTQRGRLVAAGVGLMFLSGVDGVLGPAMWHLMACLLCLVDWTPLSERRTLADVSPAPPLPPRMPARGTPIWAVTVVGLILIAANSLLGLLAVRSWPFTVYPPFAYLVAPYREHMVICQVRDGVSDKMDTTKMQQIANPARWLHRLQGISRLPEGVRHNAFLDLCRLLVAQGCGVQPDDRLQLWRTRVSTIPEERSAPPLETVFICEVKGSEVLWLAAPPVRVQP